RVLDGVGQQIEEGEFQPADIDGQLRQRVRHSDLHTASVRHLTQLPGGFLRDRGDGYGLNHGVITVAADPGDRVHFARQVSQVQDVALDGCERPLRPFRSNVRLPT